MTEQEKKIEELEAEIASLKTALVQRTKAAHKKAAVDFVKMASELNENAGILIEKVQPVATKAAQKAGEKIKERPFMSVCAALGVGLLLASLSNGKK